MVNNQADRSRQRAREDYLKAVYHLGSGKPVRAVALSRHLGVSRASVSKLRRVLERDGLLTAAKSRADALQLTADGMALALRVVRRHRLVETFLHRSLAVPLDRVHSDAERIEHSISDDIARRLADYLGNPTSDPHGHEIPGAGQKRPSAAGVPLSGVAAGSSITVIAVDDDDATIMRALIAHNVLPGVRAMVVARDAVSLQLRTGRQRRRILLETAASVRCSVDRGRLP